VEWLTTVLGVNIVAEDTVVVFKNIIFMGESLAQPAEAAPHSLDDH
jgi:hypothetical protein